MVKTHGLFMTKAAPFHNGHKYCIDEGLKVVDRITVVVYETDFIDIPLETRCDWIREQYRDYPVTVIGAFGGPAEMGYTDEIMRAHEDFIYVRMGIKGVTHVISSEPYGEHMSKAVGAVDLRIDPPRINVPVSGTLVRADPAKYKDCMPRHVYSSFVKKVLVIGAPSTGKTTLCSILAERNNCLWMHEHGRYFWQEHQVDRKLSNNQLLQLALEHLEMENSIIYQSNGLVFVDTSALTTLLFAREYWGEGHPMLIHLARKTRDRYDHIFLLDKSIPYDDTWERDGESERDEMHRRYIDILSAWKIPYTYIQGQDLEDRIMRVESTIFEKEKGL